MGHSQGDPKLGEVKAVLQRLQTFSAQPDSAEVQGEATGTYKSVGKGSLAIVAMIGGAFALIGVIWLIFSPVFSPAERPDPPASQNAMLESSAIPSGGTSISPPALRPAASRAATEVAQNLLMRGQVQAARTQLLGLVSEDTADVAWMLARSYDPNVLATIPAADAGPDIEQATRWYRAWHAAAVTQGLVPSSVSVERIIRSMR